MKKLILPFVLAAMCRLAIAQENLQADKESIVSIEVGNGYGQVNFYYDEEGFKSPGSPFIDALGRVVFFNTANKKHFLVIEQGKIGVSSFGSKLSWFRETGNRHIDSQQGVLLDWDPLQFVNNQLIEYSYASKGVRLVGPEYYTYPAPFGALIFSDKQKAGIAVVFDIKSPKADFSVVGQSELKAWLARQSGGFTIEADGYLYRNGLKYSPTRPESALGKYQGRLASGHVIWASGGQEGMESTFTIATPSGQIEAIMVFPWAPEDSKRQSNPFTYGVGPWGEFYCLLAPLANRIPPWPPANSFAELVVVRNHLKFFGRLNDGGVRLRNDPTTSGEILGTYPNKTGFRILEIGSKEETIGGQKHVWYKVRLLDGKEGWFFGAFVQNLYDGPNGKAPPWPNVPDW